MPSVKVPVSLGSRWLLPTPRDRHRSSRDSSTLSPLQSLRDSPQQHCDGSALGYTSTGWILPISAGSQLQNDEFSKTFQASTIHRGNDKIISLFKTRYCYSHISKSFQINMQGSAEYLNPKEERHKACYSCQGKAESVCARDITYEKCWKHMEAIICTFFFFLK